MWASEPCASKHRVGFALSRPVMCRVGPRRISSAFPCAFRVKLGKLGVPPRSGRSHAQLRGSLTVRDGHIALGGREPISLLQFSQLDPTECARTLQLREPNFGRPNAANHNKGDLHTPAVLDFSCFSIWTYWGSNVGPPVKPIIVPEWQYFEDG